MHQHPELRGIVARGELHLTGLLMIAPYLGGPRHTEVIERARFRAKREIARLVAEIDPKPEVPARIEPIAPAAPRRAPARAIASAFVGPVRSLPEGDRPADWIEPAGRGDTGAGGEIAEPEGTRELSDAEQARELADPEQARELAEAEAALDRAWLAKQQARPERPLRFRVQFTAEQEYVDLLEEAFDLLDLKKRAASLPELQLRALRELVERLRQRRTGTRRRVRALVASSDDAACLPLSTGRDAAPARARALGGPSRTPEREPDPSSSAPERELGASSGSPTRELQDPDGAPDRDLSAPDRDLSAPDRDLSAPDRDLGGLSHTPERELRGSDVPERNLGDSNSAPAREAPTRRASTAPARQPVSSRAATAVELDAVAPQMSTSLARDGIAQQWSAALARDGSPERAAAPARDRSPERTAAAPARDRSPERAAAPPGAGWIAGARAGRAGAG